MGTLTTAIASMGIMGGELPAAPPHAADKGLGVVWAFGEGDEREAYALRSVRYELRGDGLAMCSFAQPGKLNPMRKNFLWELFVLLEHMYAFGVGSQASHKALSAPRSGRSAGLHALASVISLFICAHMSRGGGGSLEEACMERVLIIADKGLVCRVSVSRLSQDARPARACRALDGRGTCFLRWRRLV